jgi:two-component system sensor histidine kinase KdpD
MLGMFYLMALLLMSFSFRQGPLFFAATLFAIIWDVYFLPPLGSTTIVTFQDLLLVAILFFTVAVVSLLVDRLRVQQEMLTKREESTQHLYDIVRQIANARSMPDIFETIKARLEKVLDGKIEFVLKELDNGLQLEKPSQLVNGEKEKNAAIWVFEHGNEAGWSTPTLPSVKNLYVPLKGFQEIVGIAVYHPNTDRNLSNEQKNFLSTVCQQLANFLERTFASEKKLQHEQLKQMETIHRTVLERLAHEFKKPLLSVQKALIALHPKLKSSQDPNLEKEFQQLEKPFKDLSKILANISAMAQLVEGMIPLNKEMHHIDELIRESRSNLKKETLTHQIAISTEPNLPMIPFDYYLIEMLLYNLIFNAIDNSPPRSTIHIEAKRANGYVVMSVADEGKGIPESRLESIFEKFYRLPDTQTPGMGLGLSIVKAIAEIHEGYLKVENLPVSGAKFSLFLPIEFRE